MSVVGTLTGDVGDCVCDGCGMGCVNVFVVRRAIGLIQSRELDRLVVPFPFGEPAVSSS